MSLYIRAVTLTEPAQRQEARAVSALARQETARGDAMTGMLADLGVVRDETAPNPRPRDAPAAMALLDAWLSHREIVAMIGHKDRVRSAWFSPDGKRVVTASWDGKAIVYLISSDIDLMKLVRGSLTRCLTITQREAFGPSMEGSHDTNRNLFRAPPC